ncbi:chromosome segregation ATPase [Lipingzhangella halophila]|uniref:Chromosome segregation ATPase n=1 Tax=Lipingzhangella halophila TaxID=1783352 RepID=A0A7W7RC56_9ACTN|nr:hypothetical protein [Lipingzhangella halophila]MBB4929272.1 chromosome segregation ATPase [Lipingzhangella halophila]
MQPLEVVVLVGIAVLAVGGGLAHWGRAVLVTRKRRGRLLARFDEVAGEIDTIALQMDEAVRTLRRDVELVRGAFAPEEVPEVLGSCEERLTEADELLRQRSELSGDTGESLSGRSSDEIVRVVDSWRELERAVQELLPQLRAEEERLSAALSLGERVTAQLDRVRQQIDEVRSAADTSAADGFVVTTESEVLDVAAERVAEAERLAAENRLHAADTSLAELSTDLAKSRETLLSLRRRRAELTTRLASIRDALGAADQQAEEAEEHRETLTGNYAPGIWAGLTETVEHGRSHLDRAGAELSAAEDALGKGDIGGGERLAEAAESELGTAGEQFAVPIDRLATVRELSRSLPATKEQVLARVVALERNVAANEAANPMADVVAELRRQLDYLDMTVYRPDWLLYERRVAEIDVLVTTVDAALRQSVADTERLRADLQQMEAELATARQAREKAERELAWHLDQPFRRR